MSDFGRRGDEPEALRKRVEDAMRRPYVQPEGVQMNTMTEYTNCDAVLPETLRKDVQAKIDRLNDERGHNDPDAETLMRSLVLEAYCCGKAAGIPALPKLTVGRYDDNTWGVYDGDGKIVRYGFFESQDAHDWIEENRAAR